MSNFSTQVIESDKFGVLPTRLDDIKKLWKILKVSLLESLTTYNHFGKSLFKASRNLHFTFNHADPSFFCKLTLSLLTRQAQTSHLLSQSVNEAFTEITKDMEAYEEKLEQVRLQTFDTISEGLKFLTLARVNYVKEKEKYEKACKEAESWVTEKKKPITDPLLYYNLTHLRRLKRKVMEALHTLNAAEQQAKDALEVFSVRQKGLNLGLSESMHLFKGTLQTIYERMVKAVKRHNKVLAQFLAKELEDVEKSNVLVSIDNFTFAPESEEQQFINSKKLAHGDSDLSKESKESKDAKLRYPEIHSKLLQKPQESSDTDCLDYVDLAQKHFEASSLIFEDRQKVVKGLKGYMQELSTLCATIEKTFQKLSKNSPSQQSASVLCRKIGISVDPFFDSLEAFGAMFNQLASFINTKSFVLDNILNDQRENFKAFQLSYGKSLKDPINLKAVVMALNAQVERLYKKIAETSEKDPGDERIPAWKVELDAVRKQREEQLQELRKQVAEAAKGITRAFEDHRAREQTKYIDFSAVIKGILTQENIFSRNLSETLSVMEGNLEGKDINVSQALAQDDLNGFLQYYELNMQENLNGQRAKDTSIVFQKLYTPPADALTEDDDKMIVEAEDTEEQAVKEDEDSEYLKKRFGLKSTERLLDSFACGIEQTIIRQGRMYVYPSAVCFTTVKLLGDFALKIPVGDMVRVEKKTMTLVFDTALSIFTKNGEIKFLAFMTRDRAFSLITSLPSREYSQTSSPERADKKGGSLESSPKQESAPIDSERKRQIQDIIRERIQRTEPEEEGESKEELRRKSLVLSDDGEAQPEQKKKSNEEKKELPAGEGKEKKAHSLEEKAPELAVTTPASNETLRKEGRTPEESVEEAALKKAHSSGEAVKKVSNEGEEVKKKLVAEEVKSSDNSAPIVARRKASSTGGRRKGTEEINPEEENEKKRLKEIIEARKPKIRAPVKPDDIYPQLVVQEVFSCSAIDMWNAVFSDKKITHKGRSYDCFWMVAKVDAGDTEIKHTKWTPNVSYEGLIEDKTTLDCLKKVAEGAQVSTRGFMYTHPVKDGGPFVPKTCQVEEKQIGYWLGPDEFIMQMDVFTSKIPLSDTFVVKNSFKVRDLPGKKCEFSWRLGVEFVKSTMFKGKIQKTSQEENGLYANNIFMPVLRENIAVYMKEKATLIKRKEAHKEAEKEAAKKLKEEAAAVENKVENLNQEPANEEKNSVEEKKEKIAEAKENDETDLSGREEESEKQDKVGLRETIEGEIAKLLKVSEQSREEMKSEIKGLKMLILALLAINCVMFFMFLKK